MVRHKLYRTFRVLASVRMRAGLIVMLAVLPLIGLMVSRALAERDMLLHDAQLRALDTARLLAQWQDSATQEMTTLLVAASRLPSVSDLDGRHCRQDLDALVAGRRDQLWLWATDATGHIACSSFPGAVGTDLSHSPAFRSLMAPDGPERLQTFAAHGSFRPAAVVLSQLTLFDHDGSRAGILTATLPFRWLTDVARALGKWTDDPIFLIDLQTGEVLARSVQPENWVGRRFPDHPVLQAFRAAPGAGMIDARNPRGVDQLFGYAPLQPVGGRHVLLVVALGRTELLAAASRRLVISVAIAVAFGLLSVLSAWWAAHLSLLQPIRQLMEGARHLGSRVARPVAPLSPWHAPELRLLEASLRARSRRVTSARAALAASEAKLRLLAESTSDVIMHLDREMRVLYVSPAVQEMLGCSPAAFMAAARDAGIHPDDLPQVQAGLAELSETGRSQVMTYRRRGAEGWVWIETTGRLASDGTGFVCVLRDVTRRQEADERIRHMAHHDGLTGLANREELRRQLEAMLDRARQDDGEGLVRILCIDLDRFKQVNDSFGHMVGDVLLREVARRLRGFVEDMPGAAGFPDRLAARLGGDEFAVALYGTLTDSGLAGTLDGLVARLCEPVRVGSYTVQVGASIGVACHPQHGTTVTDLLRNADAALYRVKQAATGGFALFNPALASEQRRRQQLERDLRGAMQAGELHLVYQPIVDVRTRAVVSVEALLRWQHPTLGAISPAEFIRLAEESGQIEALGLWVLRTACRQAVSWPQAWGVAVNLSPVQVQHDSMPDQVTRILAETGLPGSRLKLEITEGLLIQDEERARRMMHALQAHGVSIALDDFGTGYASLSYLGGLPFDTLKIDRSLVQAVASRPQQPIIRAVFALAEALNMDVIAEGVETTEQFELLRRMGCPKVQGFLLGRPVPAEQLPWPSRARPGPGLGSGLGQGGEQEGEQGPGQAGAVRMVEDQRAVAG